MTQLGATTPWYIYISLCRRSRQGSSHPSVRALYIIYSCCPSASPGVRRPHFDTRDTAWFSLTQESRCCCCCCKKATATLRPAPITPCPFVWIGHLISGAPGACYDHTSLHGRNLQIASHQFSRGRKSHSSRSNVQTEAAAAARAALLPTRLPAASHRI